jgi:hypothetical protein
VNTEAVAYETCGARIGQGDILWAPTALFTSGDHVARGVELDAPGPPLRTRDVDGLAASIPRLEVGNRNVVLRAWYTMAMVVSPDCASEKQNVEALQVAPILPLTAVPKTQRDGVRAGTNLTACFLPSGDLPTEPRPIQLPESFVDVLLATPVAPHLLTDYRMGTLGPDLLDRFAEFWIRHVAGQEISSTGTIAGARGATLDDVEVLQSSRRRHTVLLTFSDGSHLVLYQDPRRKDANVQSVEINGCTFSRDTVSTTMAATLVLSIENEDSREFTLSCDLLQETVRVLRASTTHIMIPAADAPGVYELRNSTLPNARPLTITFRD